MNAFTMKPSIDASKWRQARISMDTSVKRTGSIHITGCGLSDAEYKAREAIRCSQHDRAAKFGRLNK